VVEFIDYDHAVMREYYDIIEQDIPASTLLQKMQRLMQADENFYDPFLISAEILFAQGKTEEAQAIAKDAYERAVARIVDSKGRWPKFMRWGFLENRHLMRALEFYAGLCWAAGDCEEALKIYRQLLHINPEDNQGVRYTILAIRMGLGQKEWQRPFVVEKDGKIIGLDAYKSSKWFDENVQKFPEEFEQFLKFHEQRD